MKIFKISQNENNGYDTFDSAVVIAENEEQARDISPFSSDKELILIDWNNFAVQKKYYGNAWACRRSEVIVEYLGEAKEQMSPGVVCASFNAG